MVKVLVPFFSFVLFAICAVNFFPRNHNSPKRSIASIDVIHEVGQRFKSLQESNSLESLDTFINQNRLQKIEVSGKLNAYIDETTPNSKPLTQYFIVDDKGDEVPVEVNSEIASELIGKDVAFSGFKDLDKKFGILESNPISQNRGGTYPFEQQLEEVKFNDQKMLIMFFKFNTSTRTYLNMEQARSIAYQGYAPFFGAMSEGKLQHQITVSGWHHLNRNEVNQTGEDCWISNQEIKDAAQADGLDLTEYDNISMISNCTTYFTIGGRAILNAYDWLGIGKKMTWVKMLSYPTRLASPPHAHVPGWTSFVSILAHERGHNFGLMHSNALDCGDGPYLQNCEHIEYGNKFDRMGGPDGSYIFNADQQRRANWKNETTDFHHIKESGNYIIDRLTTTGRNKKIGAYIYDHKGDKKAFMVEYRQADGFDNNLSSWIFRDVWKGVHLYSSMGPSTVDKSPKVGTSMRYIDSNPTTADWHADTAYESLTGEYYDPVNGITIYNTGIFGTKAHIYVEFDEDKRVCYQKTLKDKMARPYITRYFPIGVLPADNVFERKSRNRRSSRFSQRSQNKTLASNLRNSKDLKSSHIVLIPGDDFKVKYQTFLADNLLCPRSDLNIKWLNGEQFFSWIKESPIKPGGGSGPASPGGAGRIPPIGGGGGGHDDPPSFNTNHNMQNYDKVYSYIPELKVPADTLNKNYMLRFEITDNQTGEVLEKTVYLHIRSKHNAIIELPVDPVRL